MVVEVLADVRPMQTFEEKFVLCYVYLHLCKVNMQLFKERGGVGGSRSPGYDDPLYFHEEVP